MKVLNILARICGIFLVFLSGALLIIMFLSKAYLGDGLGLFKILRTAQIITQHYAGLVDERTLLDGALEGLVEKLGDEHSLYLDGKDFKEFSEATNASYAGIGVYIAQTEDKKAFIAGVIEDSPAEEAGLKRGDIIEAVNGIAAEGRELSDLSQDIRGEVDTTVILTILRNGEREDVPVVRRNITLLTVAGKMLDGTDTGYIRISSFSTATGDEFGKIYKRLKGDGMKRLILDLRNNPGGLVDQAVRVAEYLLPPGSTVVSYMQRDGEEEVFTTTGTDDRIPLVVLVNENSASAAEILSGDIQDLHAGVLIGMKTYGKGTVQGVFSVDTDEAVKVTIAKYKTAAGREVDGTGIEPDITVQLQPNSSVDYQLERAKETISGMMQDR